MVGQNRVCEVKLHYDQDGNLQRAYTDLGYDPDGQNTGNDPAFRFIDHLYTYDAAGRPTGLVAVNK